MYSKRIRTLSACSLIAASGLASTAQATDWASAVDGNWNNAANWSPTNVPNTVGEDANLGLAGVYTVLVTDSFSIGAMNITNANAIASLGSDTLTLNGAMLNQGTMIVNTNASIFNSLLRFNANTTLMGSGSVFLNAGGQTNDASVGANGGFTLTHALGHTIHGAGQVVGSMTNSGMIVSDVPASVGLGNNGIIVQTATGMFGADSSDALLFGGSSITGGELFTINGGSVRINSGVASIGDILNSGSLDVPGGGFTLAVFDTVTNNGTITLNSSNQIFNAILRFDANTMLASNGNVLMKTSGNSNDAQILAPDGITGTIGSSQIVEGSGQITGVTPTGVIHNTGVINANDASGAALILFGNHTGTGTYRSDDSTLGLGSGVVLNGGTFNSSGTGIVDALNGTITISNMTNSGQMGIRGQGAFVNMLTGMVNNGDIAINSDNDIFNAHLDANANATISGTGTITMQAPTNTGDAILRASDGFTLTLGSGQTVQGAGIVEGRGATGTIHNNGTFIANDSALPLEMRGNHTGTGTYRGDNDVLGIASGAIVDGGTFDSSGAGSVEALGGTSTISNITNNGQMGIRGQGTFVSMLTGMVNNGDIAINSDNDIFNAHLDANANATISGTGTITMQSPTNTGDALVRAFDGFTLTFNSGQTIQGAGIVDGRGATGTIHNNGTFIGNDPVLSLEMRGNHIGTGTYLGDNGVLGLASGAIMDGGTFDSSGTGSVEALGGTITISNIANNGQMGIRGQGTFVEMLTDFTNNGTININPDNDIFNAHLRAGADVMINGTGTITMQSPGNTGDARILPSGFALTIGSGQTITGSGELDGTMTVEGTIDPDGAPLRHIDVDQMTLTPTSTVIADLGGLLGGEFDRILLGGSDTIDLGGASIEVNLDGGYLPLFGDTWDIIDGGTIIGSFDSITVPAAPSAQIYRVVEEPSRVFVVLTCQADFTGDNFLDVFDVFFFLDLFNSGSLHADFTGDGSLDIFDVFLFLQFFNGGCTGV